MAKENKIAALVMEWSGLAYLTGIILNWGTFLLYDRKMPVPLDGPSGYIIDARHVIGYAPTGDIIPYPPGWWTSPGDWLIIIGGLILWISMAVYLVNHVRVRRSRSRQT